MRIVWSPLALERAEAIAREIAADRPSVAREWIDGLFARVGQLRQFPESGRRVPEIQRPEIRELPYPPYRVIYRCDASRVVILTVRHGRRRFDTSEI